MFVLDLSNLRDKWAQEDCYRNPGPVQYSGEVAMGGNYTLASTDPGVTNLQEMISTGGVGARSLSLAVPGRLPSFALLRLSPVIVWFWLSHRSGSIDCQPGHALRNRVCDVQEYGQLFAFAEDAAGHPARRPSDSLKRHAAMRMCPATA